MGYILTPGVNGVNGVKEEGRGMEGIWGKSPARGKRAATPGRLARRVGGFEGGEGHLRGGLGAEGWAQRVGQCMHQR